MKKYILLVLVMLPTFVSAQNVLWKDYFSYREITDVFAANEQAFVATKNSVFVMNADDELVAKYNTVNGLKVEDIRQVFYSVEYQKIIVGSQNGSLALIDTQTGKITHFNDIANKTTLSTAEKIVYDVAINGDILYVATGFGIAEILLDIEEFGDSYFFAEDGISTEVMNLAIVGDYLYANTNNVGIKRIDLNDNMLNDSNWQIVDYENWLSIINFNDQLVGVKDDLTLNAFTDDSYQQVGEVYGGFLSLCVYDGMLTAVTYEVARCYYSNFSWENEYIIPQGQSYLTSAVTIGDKIYCGSQKDGFYSITRNSEHTHADHTPEGPLSNRVSALKIDSNNQLWTVFGGYDNNFNPYLPQIGLGMFGINRLDLNTDVWQSISYGDIAPFRATSHIEEHPLTKDIYISSFHDGLLKLTPNPTELAESTWVVYNHENTGASGIDAYLQTPGDADSRTIRINGPAFEPNGKGWITNGYSDRLIKSFEDNQWRSYNVFNQLSNSSNKAYTAPVIDKNGVKWVGTFQSGAFAFNESPQKLVNITNLPSTVVNTIAIDGRNQVWIGTNNGLRMIPSVDNFSSNSTLNSQSIIIMDDGLAQELFYQQNILKIKVDGSNNKWVAVAGAGVFLVSADGQQTVYHFDTSNSPLPADDIVDIEIDDNTGEVFFATNQGLVSYQHYATAPKADLENVYFFPNPVKPEFEGEVKISGLMQSANIKITDIAGNLVYETTATGGSALWNTRNFAGRKVASGVYIVFVSSDDGSEKSVGKIMVIR